MSRARAALSAIDLPTLYTPLRDSVTADPTQPIPPAADPGNLVEMYPSLGARAREYMIPLSHRIFISQDQDLKTICSLFDVEKSALVRDILDAGIRAIKTDLAEAGKWPTL